VPLVLNKLASPVIVAQLILIEKFLVIKTIKVFFIQEIQICASANTFDSGRHVITQQVFKGDDPIFAEDQNVIIINFLLEFPAHDQINPFNRLIPLLVQGLPVFDLDIFL
jgi:hypothetical protein